jgi:surfeit locus 1 family protein
MLQKLKTAGLIGPTIATMAGVALLMSLGQWQWSRKAWKEGLIAAQTARAKAEPVPLPDLVSVGIESSQKGRDYDLTYRRVTLTGALVHQAERHVYAPLNSGPGWQVMTPMLVDGSPLAGGRTIWIFVDRGFVPDHLKDATTRALGLPSGDVTVTGRLMPAGTKGSFTPENDPVRNRWFWRDLGTMWAPAKMQHGGAVHWSGYYVEAAATSAIPGGWPKPGMSDAIFNNLSNRHLEYALTWWALAATLVGMYFAFARSKWPTS